MAWVGLVEIFFVFKSFAFVHCVNWDSGSSPKTSQ